MAVPVLSRYYEAMIDLDPLVNKTVAFRFNGADLRLDLSHALFSSFDVDQGTRLLLKAVARDPVLGRARRVLDAGCGTGVIGLAVAKAFPEAEVVMRDRDSLAVAFAERNRLANKLRGRTAWSDPGAESSRTAVAAPRVELGLLSGGIGGGAVPEESFDFVLSNLPAKAGGPVLEDFFARAVGRPERASGGFLAPEGRLAVVIVNTLAEKAAGWIQAAGLVVVASERGSGHSVFVVERASSRQPVPTDDSTSVRVEAVGAFESREGRASQSAENPEGQGPAASEHNGEPVPSSDLNLSGLDLSTYIRGESSFSYADAKYRAMGFWGLPDFDTIGYGSVVAAETAARALAGSLVREVLVVNPGAGHLPLWLSRKLRPDRITAASRDILSLAATRANIAASAGRSVPACRCMDALRLDELAGPPPFDFIAEFPDVIPEYDWIGPAWERASRLTKAGGVYLVACAPTELARFEKRRPTGWLPSAERKRKGFASAAWTRLP